MEADLEAAVVGASVPSGLVISRRALQHRGRSNDGEDPLQNYTSGWSSGAGWRHLLWAMVKRGRSHSQSDKVP